VSEWDYEYEDEMNELAAIDTLSRIALEWIELGVPDEDATNAKGTVNDLRVAHGLEALEVGLGLGEVDVCMGCSSDRVAGQCPNAKCTWGKEGPRRVARSYCQYSVPFGPGTQKCACHGVATGVLEVEDEDPRRAALKRGLRQCTRIELERLLQWIEDGHPILLDRDEDGAANYSESWHEYCPLAIARDLPFLFEHYDEGPSDERVTEMLKRAGLEIFNTRGISGEFYMTDRRRDLEIAVREVLEEKSA